ncbi:hypothetical protein A9Q98_11520 [Thalassotalea sp. 42_200_T64]|nr:hypothetical protein A9Q98_11520 [Thalassotalea sp. 42_200_T64]
MKLTKPLAIALLGFMPFVSFADDNSEQASAKAAELANQCGVVSIYKQPPQSKNIYWVNINTVDGVPVGSGSHTFQLSPGLHKIKVVEQITDSYFTRRRGKMLNYKVFEINVEPNKKYYLGAKYLRKHRSKLTTGEYWEPIIWKTSDRDCEV